MSAERGWIAMPFSPCLLGFNGAALVGVRRAFPASDVPLPPVLLQRSRTRWSAERKTSAADCAWSRCFNGAALVGVRRGPLTRQWDFRQHRFNGAALVGVRRVEERRAGKTPPVTLQRSRTRWSAESTHQVLGSGPDGWLQRSRTRWSAESPRHDVGAPQHPPRFNGAALVGVRRESPFFRTHTHPFLLQRSRTRWSAES